MEASQFDGRFDPGGFLVLLVTMKDYFDWYSMDDAQCI